MVLLSGKESWNKNPKCEHAIIGAGGFVLEDVAVNAEMSEIDLAIGATKREQCQRGICHRVYWELEVAGPSRFEGLVNIGEEYCPNARRCIDPFHVVFWVTDALDQVHWEVWSEAHRKTKSLPKRKLGHPTKSEIEPEKMQANGLKNLCYALLKNPGDLPKNR